MVADAAFLPGNPSRFSLESTVEEELLSVSQVSLNTFLIIIHSYAGSLWFLFFGFLQLEKTIR